MTDINRETKNETKDETKNETKDETKNEIKDETKNETKDETKNDNTDTTDSNTIKRLKNTVEVFNIIRALFPNLTSDPFKKAMEERIQKSIIDHIESFPIESIHRQKENIEPYKDTDVPIYEKLSSGEVYIIRIIDNELEVIENCDGDVVYKRVKFLNKTI